MRLSEIEFGAFLSYSPQGNSEDQLRSRTAMRKLKDDEHVESPKVLMSDYIADGIRRDIEKLPFSGCFTKNSILVPAPNSSLTGSGTLWIPQRLAEALVRKGLGRSVETCLRRIKPLRKAAKSSPKNRPKAIEHCNSMDVQRPLYEIDEILLVDDVVTRGATLLGAANRLADAYPKARIRAFAGMRTISNPLEFVNIVDPIMGKITLGGDGNTFRRP